MAEPGLFKTGQVLSAAMMIYTPKNMELVREAGVDLHQLVQYRAQT
jgi:hypothetical protein